MKKKEQLGKISKRTIDTQNQSFMHLESGPFPRLPVDACQRTGGRTFYLYEKEGGTACHENVKKKTKKKRGSRGGKACPETKRGKGTPQHRRPAGQIEVAVR